MKTYFVYEIECNTPNHFYVGLTEDFDRRIRQHQGPCGGSVFTKTHGVKSAKVVTTSESLDEAKRLEWLHVQTLDKEGFVVRGAGRTGLSPVAKESNNLAPPSIS